ERVSRVAADTATTAERHSPIRSSSDRVAPARRATLEENPRRLFGRTPASSAKRFDACRTGGRFYACGTCAGPPPWVSAHHAWPNYPASGNGRDLLFECSFLRVTDVETHCCLCLARCGGLNLPDYRGDLFGHRRFDGRFQRRPRSCRGLVRRCGLDCNKGKMSDAVLRVEGNSVAGFVPEQCLPNGGLI